MTPAVKTKTDAASNGQAVQDQPYRFAVLPLKYMIVDAYQRPLTNFVDEIEQDFRPALVGTVCVSKRSNTKYAVIDGQTRVEGMRRLGMVDVPCLVYENLTPALEAALFADFQTKRRGMHSASRFLAQVIAEEPEAVDINAIARKAGFKISVQGSRSGTPEIAAVGALEFAYRGTQSKRRKDRDPELLKDVLDVIQGAWPRLPDTAKGAVMVKGIAWYLARDPDDLKKLRPANKVVDYERLIDRLQRVTPSELAKRAEGLREGRGMSGNSPAYMAEAIHAQYRKQR